MWAGILSLAKLTLIWAWFAGQVVAPPCLTPPNLIVVEQPAVGFYASHSAGDIRISERAPAYAVIHEMAHYYAWTCRVPERPVGRAFALRMGSDATLWWAEPDYMQRPSEHFAGTLNWLLTGHRDWGLTETDPAVFRPLVRRIYPDYDPATRGDDFRLLAAELREMP